MSYVALATSRFDEVVRFYGTALGFPKIRSWDRPRGRGCMFDLGGLRLEVLDAAREQSPQRLGDPAERINLVVEVDDLEAVRRGLGCESPDPTATSWGARLFRVFDPDGVPVWFLQWVQGSPVQDRSVTDRFS